MEYDIEKLEAELDAADKAEKLIILKKLITAYWGKSLEKSIECGQQALAMALEVADPMEESEALYSIALAHHYLANYQKALQHYKKSLEIKNTINDEFGIGKIYNNIGNIYNQSGNYHEAYENYQKALTLQRKINDQKGISLCLNNIGLVYWKLKKPEKAIYHYTESLKICQESNDKRGVIMSLSNLGAVYYDLEDLEKSMEYHRQALELEEEIQDTWAIPTTLNNLSILYQDMGVFSVALNYSLRSLELSRKNGDQLGIANTLKNIGLIYLKTNNYDKSLSYMTDGLQMAQKIGAKDLVRDNYLALSELYEAQEDYKNAFNYYRLYTKENDEIFSEDSRKQLAEMEAKYEAEIYRLKNVELVEAFTHLKTVNKEKNELLEIISLDLKNPLTSILGFAQILGMSSEELSGAEIKKFALAIEESGNQMLQLIVNLLNMNRLDSGKVSLSPQNFDLNYKVIAIVDNYRKRADAKRLNFKLDLDKYLNIYADSNATEQILDNVISNAVKFSPFDKNIYLRLFENGNYIRFEIQDEGQGITEEDRRSIFGKFSRLSAKPTDNEPSTGLGLFIVKRLTEMLNGRVSVESDGKDMGTTLIVELPKAKNEDNF